MASNEEFIRRNKIRLVDNDKNTKLHYAAALGNLEEVEKIVATRQKLDPENYLGWTPLMMAARNGCIEVLDVLLLHGADSTKTNKFGLNVFLICVSSGNLKNVERLLRHLLCGGVSRQSLQKTLSPISLSILFGHHNIFRYLLEKSFSPNAMTSLTGITPTMFAAAMNNTKAMRKLKYYKVNNNTKNYLGKTASDILSCKLQKMEIDTISKEPKAAEIPLILIAPEPSPQLQLTSLPIQTPQFISAADYRSRKSSDVTTPVLPPDISPIPTATPQFFFGPNWSPSQFILAPNGNYSFHSNSFLNAHIGQTALISPVIPQIILPSVQF